MTKIDEDSYRKWYDESKLFMPRRFIPNLRFKQYLIKEIEDRLKK
jgi:hypothetical protein